MIRLNIKLEEVLDRAWVAPVEAYFRGEVSAFEACKRLGCDRTYWDRMIAGLIDTVISNQREAGDDFYGSVEVEATPSQYRQGLGRLQPRQPSQAQVAPHNEQIANQMAIDFLKDLDTKF